MTERARAALAQFTDPTRPPLQDRVAIVVAHPDDEVLGCGSLIARLRDCRLIHVTDGAPRGGDDAHRHGFADPAAYARARSEEVAAALAAAGRSDIAARTLGVSDQGAAHDLVGIARRLMPLLADRDLVLTHAYEGGHPDHDATAFAVWAAVTLLARASDAPAIVELPFYRAGPDGEWIRQSFANPEGVVVLALTPAEQAVKRAMLDAHASQRDTLREFALTPELYRSPSEPDFTVLPNGGALLYERYGWGLTGARWLDLARDAMRDLAL